MQTLDTLRRHIETAEDLQSIVRTMKSLSAVSIRQYENAAASLADYDRTVELGLRAVLRQHRSFVREDSDDAATAAIVFGSDHGLCGRFNEEIADFAVGRIRDLDVSPDDCPLAAVGFRAANRLEGLGMVPDDRMGLPGSAEGLAETVRLLILRMDAWRERRDVARILVFHNRRTDQTMAEPQMLRLLPLDAGRRGEIAGRRWPSRMLPLLATDADRLFSALVREYLFVGLFRAGAESMASEHASRLAAMQAAERNIEDHLTEVNAAYRRRRQQSITDEILDVVSGFEALRSEDGSEASPA